jgi:transposase-like protein
LASILGVMVVIVRFSKATKQPRGRTMTNSEFALSDLAARLAGTDASLSTSLRDILADALQELIEAEPTSVIGAGHGERAPDRLTQRNGHRPKLLSTPAGDVELGIPTLRRGSFFPDLLEPRRRIGKRCGR